jgi:hypothetical protein
MRNHFTKITLLTGIVLTLSALTVHGQGGNSFAVDVPFKFTVSGKTLPAGKYQIMRSAQASAEGLTIRATDKGAYAQTMPVQSGAIQSKTVVVFKRYGDQYFLYQVWIAGRSTGRQLSRSHSEKIAAREFERRSMKPETVALLTTPD